jgi:hypothetical protein
MLDLRACERRVYRLAALLSGNPTSAAGVIQAVLSAKPNLRELDSAHMDRLTVLRAREIEPGQIVDDRVSSHVARAVAELSPQQREAWIFVRVYGVPMREAAKAMDCSVTALTNHMKLAIEAVDAALAKDERGTTPDQAAAMLGRWAMAIDVPRFVEREQSRRRRVRVALVFLAGIFALGAIVGVVLLVQSWTPAR